MNFHDQNRSSMWFGLCHAERSEESPVSWHGFPGASQVQAM
ncbi:MAG TPA: hypothetical protein VFA09_09760 [Ktedonobacteraceae bacterium]|nr:hypothetical protein [Ktedonobacteraceae bacterium]